jgi:hypothetical protein
MHESHAACGTGSPPVVRYKTFSIQKTTFNWATKAHYSYKSENIYLFYYGKAAPVCKQNATNAYRRQPVTSTQRKDRTEARVSPRAILDIMVKRKILAPPG